MKDYGVFFVCRAAALLVTVYVLTTKVTAATINVPSAEAPTIQAGIDLAADGDTVLVASGVYIETIDLLGKSITLRGAEGPEVTTITSGGQPSTATVRCVSGETAQTVIDGFTIKGGEVSDGLWTVGSSPRVKNCIFTENTQAMVIDGGTPSILGSEFTKNTQAGIRIVAGEVLIENCYFSHMPVGVAVVGLGSPPIIAHVTNSTFKFHTATAMTILRGHANVTGSTFKQNASLGNGAAMRINIGPGAFDGSAGVVDCHFENNVAYGMNFTPPLPMSAGGAITTAGMTSIFGSTFVANVANEGGAIYAHSGASTSLHVESSTFFGNLAQNNGGAIRAQGPTEITDSRFEANRAWSSGGAIAAYWPQISSCTFRNNRAHFGGAVATVSQLATIDRCRFIGSVASQGGAVYMSGTITNSLFLWNESDQGSAVRASAGAKIINSTFTENMGTEEGGTILVAGADVTLANSVLWNNEGEPIVDAAESPPAVSFNLITGGHPGDENLDVDPLFVAPGLNPRLQPNSPAINSADPGALPKDSAELDLDGQPRLVGRGLDRGAFEFQTNACDPTAFEGLVELFISPASVQIKEGLAKSLIAWAHWEDGSITDVSSSLCMTWNTSDSAIASPLYDGTVTAHSTGDAVIQGGFGGHTVIAFIKCVPNGQAIYVLDSGIGDKVMSTNAKSLAWFNEFQVIEGTETITEVLIDWGGIIDPAAETYLTLWIDPNHGDDPSETRVVASIPVAISPGLKEFHSITIPPTFVGPAGTTFYVGVLQHRLVNPSRWIFAPYDGSQVSMASWIALAASPIDPNDFAGTSSWFGVNEYGNWLIRANGQPGIKGDLNHDLKVDVVDVLILLSAWGECPEPGMGNCPADLNHDGNVNIFDLLLLLASWG